MAAILVGGLPQSKTIGSFRECEKAAYVEVERQLWAALACPGQREGYPTLLTEGSIFDMNGGGMQFVAF